MSCPTWDYVVLQEPFNADAADFEKYAALFDAWIRKGGAESGRGR